jgi:hypothetical protein
VGVRQEAEGFLVFGFWLLVVRRREEAALVPALKTKNQPLKTG